MRTLKQVPVAAKGIDFLESVFLKGPFWGQKVGSKVDFRVLFRFNLLNKCDLSWSDPTKELNNP